MAKTKLELKIPVSSGEIVFECEWEGNDMPIMKRSGLQEYETTLEEFEKMVHRVRTYVHMVKEYRNAV